MRFPVYAIFGCCLIILLLSAGCADIKATQKVGDFGTAFGTTSEEQQAISWFKTTYGDPTANNNDPARFIEPMITSAIDKNNLPTDKVTTFPVTGSWIYFFVIYDNFKKGDPITVSWSYLENGKEVTSIQQQAGGDFGRFIVEFQKPDSGWGKGKQRITVTGDGATGNVEFAIGDTLQISALPYNSGGVAAVLTTIANPSATLGHRSRETGGIDTITQTMTTAAAPAGVTLTSLNLQTDLNNCGKPGNVCPQDVLHATTRCVNGYCRFSCNSGWDFDDKSVDAPLDPNLGCTFHTDIDPNNCGIVGRKCLGSEVCQDGSCASTCVPKPNANIKSCNSGCSDLKTDVNNCGFCGNKCPQPGNVVVKCEDSQCNTNPGKLLICVPGFADCDGNRQNGCEANLIYDFNCGSCGHTCNIPEICLYDIGNEKNAHCGINWESGI